MSGHKRPGNPARLPTIKTRQRFPQELQRMKSFKRPSSLSLSLTQGYGFVMVVAKGNHHIQLHSLNKKLHWKQERFGTRETRHLSLFEPVTASHHEPMETALSLPPSPSCTAKHHFSPADDCRTPVQDQMSLKGPQVPHFRCLDQLHLPPHFAGRLSCQENIGRRTRPSQKSLSYAHARVCVFTTQQTFLLAAHAYRLVGTHS